MARLAAAPAVAGQTGGGVKRERIFYSGSGFESPVVATPAKEPRDEAAAASVMAVAVDHGSGGVKTEVFSSSLDSVRSPASDVATPAKRLREEPAPASAAELRAKRLAALEARGIDTEHGGAAPHGDTGAQHAVIIELE